MSDRTKTATKFYEKNKKVLKENARNKYRNLSEEEKEVKRAYGRDIYRNMTKDEKNRLKEYQKNYLAAKKTIIHVYNMKMVKKTLNYDKVKINKRKFHASKQPVILN